MLPVASSSRSRPAGYGRSCTNCFRAKCRCALLADGGACERCRRLSKDCQPTHTARRTTAKTITPSRAAQLEDKLDNLVSMLRSSQQQQQQWQQQPNHTLHYQVAQYLPSSSDGIQSTALDSLAHAVATERDGVCVHGQQARVSPTSNGPQPGLEPWPQEADDFLAKFRTWLPSFPFMYLPPSMTAVTLRAEKPFLWLCIMSFTCTSNSQHQYLRDRVRSEISERIIINHERSMDLLLGLVAYLGWAALNAAPGVKPFIVLYTHLASLMVNELGLLRLENEEHFSIVGWKAWNNNPFIPKARTVEEMRVTLAVWFLSSLAHIFTARVETPHWEYPLDECLELVERSDDQPQDQMLVTLVKVQRIIDEAHRHLMHDLMPVREGENRAPTYLHKGSLLERLKKVRNEIPAQYSMNNLVVLQTVAAEAHIQAVGLFSENDMPDAQSVQSMYSCIKCIKTVYDTFFDIPLMDVPGLPFYTYIALSSVQLMLYRLTVANNVAWEKEIIRNTADVIDIIDRTIELLENVCQMYPSQLQEVPGKFFQSGAKFMRNLRLAWQPAVARQYTSHPTLNRQHNMGHAAPDAAAMTDASITAGQASMDLHNDPWMGLYLDCVSCNKGDGVWWRDGREQI